MARNRLIRAFVGSALARAMMLGMEERMKKLSTMGMLPGYLLRVLHRLWESTLFSFFSAGLERDWEQCFLICRCDARGGERRERQEDTGRTRQLISWVICKWITAPTRAERLVCIEYYTDRWVRLGTVKWSRNARCICWSHRVMVYFLLYV